MWPKENIPHMLPFFFYRYVVLRGSVIILHVELMQKNTHLVTGKCMGIIYSVVHLFSLQVNSWQGIYIYVHLRGPYLLYRLDVVILASIPFTGIHLVGCCALAKGCHISWAEFNFVVHGTFVRWALLCCLNKLKSSNYFIYWAEHFKRCVCVRVCLMFSH